MKSFLKNHFFCQSRVLMSSILYFWEMSAESMDSNPESCRSKQARYQLTVAIHLPKLATHLPNLATHFSPMICFKYHLSWYENGLMRSLAWWLWGSAPWWGSRRRPPWWWWLRVIRSPVATKLQIFSILRSSMKNKLGFQQEFLFFGQNWPRYCKSEKVEV